MLHVLRFTFYALMTTFFLLCKCVFADFFLPCGNEGNLSQPNRSPLSSLRWMPIYLDDGTAISSLQNLAQIANDGHCRILQSKTFSEIMDNDPANRSTATDLSGLIQNEGNHLSPNVSPDGTRFAYVSATSRESKIWLYDLVTRQHTQLKIESKSTSRLGRRARYLNRLAEKTQGGFSGFNWSDDGKYYVFSHAGDIYLGAIGIAEPIKIYEDPVYAAFPRWSRDQTKLLFTSGRTGKGDIYLIDNMAEIVQSIGNQAMSLRSNQIEASLKQLTGMEDRYEKEGEEYFTSWTKNGSFIYQAYGAYSKEQLDYDLLESTIPNLNSEVTPPQRKRVANLADDQIFPRCSPDGEKFAFYSNRWLTKEEYHNSNPQKFSIFAMEIPEKDINPASDYFKKNQKTYAALRDSQNGPLWSPDGKFLIYIADSDADKYPIRAVRYNTGVGQAVKPDRISDKRYVNNTAVDLAPKTGKIITFCTQIDSAQRLYIGVTNFHTRF